VVSRLLLRIVAIRPDAQRSSAASVVAMQRPVLVPCIRSCGASLRFDAATCRERHVVTICCPKCHVVGEYRLFGLGGGVSDAVDSAADSEAIEAEKMMREITSARNSMLEGFETRGATNQEQPCFARAPSSPGGRSPSSRARTMCVPRPAFDHTRTHAHAHAHARVVV
jgi:hypothetical protein